MRADALIHLMGWEEKMTLHKHLPKFNDNSYVHFVTATTHGNYPYFKNEEFCRMLIEELGFYTSKASFTLIGYVVMPDHVHILLWWDKTERPELSISKIMQGIKGATARRIVDLMKVGRKEHLLLPNTVAQEQVPCRGQTPTRSHRQNLKYRLWRPGFYDFNIYDEGKLLEKLNYIHHNPVKTGLVRSPGDYKWSSYGLYFGDTPGVGESISSFDIARGADAPLYPR